jgi:uracil-DNA glycosylase
MPTPNPGVPAGAGAFVPRTRELAALRAAAAGCRGCDLWESATQTVFGLGPRDAEIVVVGEQPGDREDRVGRPFVGPAGRVLRDALERAGIDPVRVYMTNAVKHFRWEARGKRRIHKSPLRWQIVACQPWFAAELEALTPRVLVLLGAVAASSVLGAGVRVGERRGRVLAGPDGLATVVTFHPSALLRGPRAERASRTDEVVSDLEVARAVISQ